MGLNPYIEVRSPVERSHSVNSGTNLSILELLRKSTVRFYPLHSGFNLGKLAAWKKYC